MIELPIPGVMRQRKPWPSVTEALTACHLGVELNIPDSKLAFVLHRGTALHSAIELDIAGELDEGSVHESIAGRLDAFRKFSAAVSLEPIVTEIELVHPSFRYCGHPDLIARVNGRVSLLDWKSGWSEHAARLQLSGYAELVRVARPDLTIEAYLIVQLRDDGSFAMHEVDPLPVLQTFLACIVIWHARKERERA